MLYNCFNIRLTSSGGGILYRIGLRAGYFLLCNTCRSRYITGLGVLQVLQLF